MDVGEARDRKHGLSARITLWASAAAALSLLLIAAPIAAGSVPRSRDQAPASSPGTATKKAGSLASSRLQQAVDALARGKQLPRGVQAVGDSLVVEVLFDRGDGGAARAAIRGSDGEPGVQVNGELVQATVPAESLEQLERSGAVSFLRPPLDQSALARDGARIKAFGEPDLLRAVPGQELGKTNATAWLNAGHRGAGVKVGVIDSFDGATWNAAQAAGEVPAPSGTFCRFQGNPCNVWQGVEHGVAVSEIVHEMAPQARIYIAGAFSAGDNQAAVNYFESQGVDIITRSLTGFYDGPGNGTGPMANVINSAVSKGIIWFNSAGNSAGRGSEPGAYWRWQFSDTDGDGYVNFAPNDELLGFDCSFMNGLRWNDWGSGRTDYDLEIYNANGTVKISESVDDQPGGAPPLENAPSCGNNGQIAQAAVKVFNPGAGTAGDTLEFMTNGSQTERYTNPFSVTGPAADSASPGQVSVGAVDPWNGTTIAGYSSEGPTNDGRIKPDLSAASCVFSFSYDPNCFNGTSAATPVAAGAAALVHGSGQATTPAALKTYLLNATVDRGAAGTDNVYGRGELRLPAPPAGGGDTSPPNVRALASKGRQGKKAKLTYQVSDNSGQSEERIQVFSKGNLKKTITTGLGPSNGTFYVTWKIPKRLPRRGARFCVTSTDPSGNRSGQSCAKLTVKKRRR